MDNKQNQTLSILIPAYNEYRTLPVILAEVLKVALPEGMQKEIIVVNDCSTDASHEVMQTFLAEHPDAPIQYVRHEVNKGKGGAIHTGIARATGDFFIIQDADTETDPQEYELLLGPILKGHADVVYGSRYIGGRPHRKLFFLHSFGNKLLTLISNLFTNLNLTDMETCYKLFRTDQLKQLHLIENRFGFEPEVTAKISKIPDIRIYEVGISYYGRTRKDGKKIGFKDAIRTLYCILRYNVFDRKYLR